MHHSSHIIHNYSFTKIFLKCWMINGSDEWGPSQTNLFCQVRRMIRGFVRRIGDLGGLLPGVPFLTSSSDRGFAVMSEPQVCRIGDFGGLVPGVHVYMPPVKLKWRGLKNDVDSKMKRKYSRSKSMKLRKLVNFRD